MLRPLDEGSVADDVADLPAGDPAGDPAADLAADLARDVATDRSADLRDRLAAEAPPTTSDPVLSDAVSALRTLVLAVERYRTSVSSSTGVGTTESQAISFLGTHGDRGQSELARELNLTSSAATALVDRLERRGVAERVRHPSDRRRTIIRLTARGGLLAERVHEPLYASLGAVAEDDLPAVSRWMAVIADGLRIARPEAV